LKPKDPAATVRRLTAAVRSGEIAEGRIDASVRKLLYWKARLGLHKDRFIDERLVSVLVGTLVPLRDADLAFIRKIIQAKPGGVIAMSYGNPCLIAKIGDVPAFLVGYGERGWFGNQAVYFESFIKLLKGDLKPAGKLPVKVSDAHPIGSGLSY